MDGYVAKLADICALADRYGALVLVDDCHATGHLGEKGRGTPALTGAGESRRHRHRHLRQDARRRHGRLRRRGAADRRPAAPAGAALSVLELARARRSPPARSRRWRSPSKPTTGARSCRSHAQRFRAGIEQAGFKVLPGVTPIIPVMLGDARLAQDLAKALDERGVYRRRLLLPRRAEGRGAHPHADVGGAQHAGHRFRGAGLRRGGAGIGDYLRGRPLKRAFCEGSPHRLALEDAALSALCRS